MKIESILDHLKAGNINFVSDNLSNTNQNSARRKETVDGQNPFAVILTCSDSRIVPELIFDTGIGELFVIRVAGNVANTSSIASIDYAVAHLNVKLIVILGHQNCGAVTAAVKSEDGGKNLNHLLKHISPALESSKNLKIDDIAKINVKLTSERLIAESDIITIALKNNVLKILPAYYSLETGQVDFFE